MPRLRELYVPYDVGDTVWYIDVRESFVRVVMAAIVSAHVDAHADGKWHVSYTVRVPHDAVEPGPVRDRLYNADVSDLFPLDQYPAAMEVGLKRKPHLAWAT